MIDPNLTIHFFKWAISGFAFKKAHLSHATLAISVTTILEHFWVFGGPSTWYPVNFCVSHVTLGYFVTAYLHESVTISRFFINYKGKRMIQNLKHFCQNLEIISKIVKLHDFYENTVSINVWYSIGIHHSKMKLVKLRINGLKLIFRFGLSNIQNFSQSSHRSRKLRQTSKSEIFRANKHF